MLRQVIFSILSISICCCVPSFGQHSQQDLVIKEQVNHIKSVMVNYPDSGKFLLKKLKEDYQDVSPWNEVLITGLEVYSYLQRRSLDTAEFKINKSLDLMKGIKGSFLERKDTLSEEYLDLEQSRASQFNNLGVIYYFRGAITESIKYFDEASGIRIPLLKHPLAEVRLRAQNEYAGTIDNIANLYNLIDQKDKALEYRLMAFKVISERADRLAVEVSLNISKLYGELDEYDSALYYSHLAYEWTNDDNMINQHYLAASLLGNAYTETGDLVSARNYLFKASEGLLQHGTADWEVNHYYRLSVFYLKAKEYENSIDAVNHALSLEGESLNPLYYEILKDAHWKLAIKNESLFQYQKAMEFSEKFHVLKDSILRSESIDEFNRLQTEFETEKKEAENQQLQLVNTQQAKANRYLIIASVALGLLVLLLIVFYRRLRRDKGIIEKQSFELQKLNDLKSEFFANISHELRTPLTLAQGNIAMLGDDVKVASQVKRVSNARRSLSQLSRMVEDLLDLSKFELGRFRLQLQSVNMATFLSRVVSSFASLAEERQVTLQFVNESVAEPFAEVDIRQFEKVINNILYNAFKFTQSDGEIMITLSQQGSSAIISISDTGRGISAQDLPNIFHRFYQASNHEHQVGSGLGLAIVKEIVDLHHAEIEVESEEGKGTQFTICINVTATVPVETEHPALGMEEIIEDKLANLKTTEPTILLVEDNVEMQDFLAEILGKYFKIEKANNGMEALDKIKQIKPSLIISDVMMPVMDGFTFLEKLKTKGLASSIPFILLTARAAGEDKLRGLRLGVDDYITKPFDREELLVRVVNLFENLQNRLKWAAENEDDKTILESKVNDEDSELIDRLKEFIESNVSNSKLSIPDLARVVAMSDRQLYRKTSEICGLTPNQLVTEVRLQVARKLLLSGEIVKLSQLAMEVGIGTPAYLSNMFFQRFGKRPTDYIS